MALHMAALVSLYVQDLQRPLFRPKARPPFLWIAVTGWLVDNQVQVPNGRFERLCFIDKPQPHSLQRHGRVTVNAYQPGGYLFP